MEPESEPELELELEPEPVSEPEPEFEPVSEPPELELEPEPWGERRSTGGAASEASKGSNVAEGAGADKGIVKTAEGSDPGTGSGSTAEG